MAGCFALYGGTGTPPLFASGCCCVSGVSPTGLGCLGKGGMFASGAGAGLRVCAGCAVGVCQVRGA